MEQAEDSVTVHPLRSATYGINSLHLSLRRQGYVIVAPDFAGLGVDRHLNGSSIRHPYTANPAHANDLFSSIQAAQAAFPALSKRFVLMGHSQGGGAAWAAAQCQACLQIVG